MTETTTARLSATFDPGGSCDWDGPDGEWLTAHSQAIDDVMKQVAAYRARIRQLEEDRDTARDERDEAIAEISKQAQLRGHAEHERDEARRERDALRDMVFSCPACGHPGARTTERDVDIHSGAIYDCDQCHARVTFTVTRDR